MDTSQVRVLPGSPGAPRLTRPSLARADGAVRITGWTDEDRDDGGRSLPTREGGPTLVFDDEEGEEASGDEAGSKKGQSDWKTSTLRITKRDHEIIRFLLRYRMATSAQLDRRFGTDPGASRRRRIQLRRGGLLRSASIGPTRHRLWLATRTAADLMGEELPPARRVAWGPAGHTLGLTSLGIHYEMSGETVRTEIEVRSTDMRAKEIATEGGSLQSSRRTPALYAPDGEARLHIPDLIIERPRREDGSPQTVAVELELNPKSPSELLIVMKRYAKASNIGSIVYYTPSTRVRDLAYKAAREAGIVHRLEVLPWVWPEDIGLTFDEGI